MSKSVIHGCDGMRESIRRPFVQLTRELNEDCETDLRVLRDKNHIVLVPVVVVHGDEPVALLHEEVGQTTNQLLQKWERCYHLK